MSDEEEGPLSKGISIKGFHVDSLELHEWPGSMRGHSTRLMVRLCVAERDSGRPSEIVLQREFPLDYMPSDRAKVVRSLLREAIMHELDECLLVDGVRVFDPHKDER